MKPPKLRLHSSFISGIKIKTCVCKALTIVAYLLWLRLQNYCQSASINGGKGS